MTKHKPTKHQDDIRRNLRKNAEINDLQSTHDGIHTCSKGCSKPGCNRGLRDTIEEQDKQIQALTGQVRQFEEHRDIAAGLIAGLEKDKAAADRATFDAIRTITELRAEFEAFMTTPTSRLLRAERKEVVRLKAEVEQFKFTLEEERQISRQDWAGLRCEHDRVKRALEQAEAEVDRLNDLANNPYRLSKGWRPIETAPMDGTDILCFCVEPKFEGDENPWTDFRVCFFGAMTEDHACWMSHYGYEQRPTHWMPLPNPPTK